MSGKAYTMQEMRRIVEYLTEHNAYSETRGRKMWMDFANSKMTNRTWQSLKETFLKRILPDIHNPYYKLSMYQIASFREGQNVEEKMKNKLEIREVNEESLANGNKKNDEHASSSKKTDDEDKGEDPKNSKIDRASTETLVLNNCYESADDIKRDLSSPTEEKIDTTKRMRDLLEFEPMTPEVQKLIDEFATDDEGSDAEPRMEIDLGDNGQKHANTDEGPITLSDSDHHTDTTKLDNDSNKQATENVSQTANDNPEVTKDRESENKEIEKNNEAAFNKENTKTDTTIENSKAILNTSDTITSTHSTMPDSILPNNQEELNKDEKLNKSKTLSLNKKGVNSKSSKVNEANENKQSKKRKNRIPSTVSDENKLQHESKKSRTESDELEKIDSIPEAVNVTDSREVHEEDKISKNVSDNNILSQSSENPCLQSVSLYDVQFSQTKNSETESSIDLNSKNQEANTSTKATNNDKNDVVILKSHSESGTSNSESCEDRGPIHSNISKRYRDNALANVFGFTSGAVRRQNSYRKRSISHQQTFDVSSGSSEWTSDSASEYISPPRGRKNRQTKKYLKPKAARLTSLEKNGGLFVVYNNKIYPLVKDGRVVKSHVNYIADSESDEDREKWKLKYLEEKKKTAELQKLLNHMQEKNKIEESRVTKVPVCSATCSSVAKSNDAASTIQDTKNKEQPKETVQDEKPVKIKFTKNNEEVQLEGPLSHITPALAQVMQLLQKGPELTDNTSSKRHKPEAVVKERRPSSSLVVTLDDEVQEKINKLEDEIFKEIEEQDKIDSTTEDLQDNVTKRNQLRRKPSTSKNSSPRSPAKKSRVEQNERKTGKKPDETKTEAQEKETAGRVTRSTKTQKNIVNEINKTENNISTRRSLTKKQTEQKVKVEETNTENIIEDSDIRYKFPSPPPTEKAQSHRNTRKTPQKKLNSATKKSPPLLCNLSNSSESMQGYQDSDVSPTTICVRRKRPSFSTAHHNKIQNRTKIQKARKKSTSITELHLDVSESSNSFQDLKQSITFHNSTLSAEVYKSDSYQLLMPININTSKRDATNMTIEKKYENHNTYLTLASKSDERITPNPDIPENAEGFSSSNVSLPTSPVLSIVENLSLSRSLLTSVDDVPDDHNANVEMYTTKITLNDLMETDLEAPMPLMEQECRIDVDRDDGTNYHYNIQAQNTLTPNSHSLINKLNTVNIEDQTLSESVNLKLKNLILDSNKKSKDKVNKGIKRIDAEDDNNNTQKGKIKKRSSTPRRRQNPRKVKYNNRQPSIEEEHMETYSCVTRRSCPPMLQINDTIIDIEKATDKNKDVDKTKTPKEKKKKDIIKVKITKPKDKNTKVNSKSNNTSFTQIDVNNSKTVLQETDNSIDLIHNHSETCLQAHECIGDSVEIIENSSSIISVNSEHSSKSSSVSLFNIDKFTEEIYNSNAQDGSQQNQDAECPTRFHTPLAPLSSANSLMTEDLSIEIPEKTPPRCTKWYLLSEDENTNPNFIDINKNFSKDIGYGANLNDIFPITCAVPDLSTITEWSKENDADTRSNLDSPLPKN